jgi:tetratricopeptide (TPR) repeat protein
VERALAPPPAPAPAPAPARDATPTPTPDATPTPTPGATASGAGAAAGAPDAVIDEPYDMLMQKAERALLADRSKLAYPLLKRAVSKRPDLARPWLKLGWAALDLGKHGESIAAFRRALAVNDGLGEAQFGLAEALRFSGQREAALAAYRTYLQTDPGGKDAAIARAAIAALE